MARTWQIRRLGHRLRWSLALVPIGIAVVVGRQEPPGAVARAVAAAKQAGKTETSILTFSEPVEYLNSIEPIVRGKSVWVATVDRRSPQVVATANSIFTWRLLRVTKRLADAKSRAESGCAVPLPAGWPAPGADAVAVPIHGGTLTIEGVTVTVSEEEAHVPTLLPSQRYVVVGMPCSDSVLSLELEFPVAGDGKLLWHSGRPVTPSMTVDALARLLKVGAGGS